MKHVHMLSASYAYRLDFEGDKNGATIHYEGAALIGSHTLCGHTDLVGVEWGETNQRVNCSGCIAVRNHVMGRERRPKRRKAFALCDCQNPEPETGCALVSEECPIHGQLIGAHTLSGKNGATS